MNYTSNRMLYIYTNFIVAICFVLVAVFGETWVPFLSKTVIDALILVYGWFGIVWIFFIVLSWKSKSGMVLCPYTIFMAFFMVFNYGQFLMWGLGIHYANELGTTAWIRLMDSHTLLKIEMVVMAYVSCFHLGALVIPLKKKQKTDIDFSSIRWLIVAVMLVSFGIEMYVAVANLKVAIETGYQALYYGDSVVQINAIMKYISYMFFPSLIAYWASCNFSNKGFWTIILLFGPYMIVNLLAGDRGNWIYYLLILIWAYLTYVKNFKMQTVLKIGIIGAAVLIVTSILVKYREIGFTNITAQDAKSVLQDLSYTFVKPFFEMGQSARVLGILIQDNLSEVWPYGSTYLAGMLAMILPRIKTWFGYPDFYIDNWMSQDYLGLSNYGVGFSITAEAYLNGGTVFGPFIMLIMGCIFGVLFNVSKDSLQNKRHMFVVMVSAGCFLPLCRGSCELMLRKWFYGCVVLLLLFSLMGKKVSQEK